jgi:hypothetical protein
MIEGALNYPSLHRCLRVDNEGSGRVRHDVSVTARKMYHPMLGGNGTACVALPIMEAGSSIERMPHGRSGIVDFH